MTIEKKTVVDLIEITGDSVLVRTRTSLFEDGKEISASFHRSSILPGECGQDEDDRVKAVCAAIHTPEVVQAYRAEQARLATEAEAARVKAEQEAEVARVQAEQEAAAAEADRIAREQAAFEAAVGAAVTKALMGGRA